MVSRFTTTHRGRPRFSLLLPALLLPAAACSGSLGPTTGPPIDDPSSPPVELPPGTTTPPKRTPPPPPPPAGTTAGGLPMLRLSRVELRNTLRDLVGDTTVLEADLPGDRSGSGGFSQGNEVAPTDARDMLDASEGIGQRFLMRNPAAVRCTGGDETACAKTFIKTFGRRAFRRAPTPEEETRLAGLYAKAKTEHKLDHAHAVRVLVQAILQSPQFLYRWELGPRGPAVDEGTGLVRLTGDEAASRLSYFLWRTMPDDVLFGEADKNALATPAQIEAQARRMLADPKARDTVADFHRQWLHITDLAGVDKSKDVYPDVSPELLRAMDEETVAFTTDAILGAGKGSLASLLTAPFTFASGPVAKIYGASGGAAIGKVDLDPTKRAGLFTQTAFLARHAMSVTSHPIKRGTVILEKLLCVELPPVPAEVPMPKPAAGNMTTRERFADHGKNECAKACHDRIDPLGFAFETYDGIGAHRLRESGKDVDASGAVALPSGKTITFDDAVDLMGQIAKEPDVAACVGKQWMRFALGRHDEAADVAALEAVTKSFTAAKHDVRELLVAIVKSNSFVYRTLSPEEVAQ